MPYIKLVLDALAHTRIATVLQLASRMLGKWALRIVATDSIASEHWEPALQQALASMRQKQEELGRNWDASTAASEPELNPTTIDLVWAPAADGSVSLGAQQAVASVLRLTSMPLVRTLNLRVYEPNGRYEHISDDVVAGIASGTAYALNTMAPHKRTRFSTLGVCMPFTGKMHIVVQLLTGIQTLDLQECWDLDRVYSCSRAMTLKVCEDLPALTCIKGFKSDNFCRSAQMDTPACMPVMQLQRLGAPDYARMSYLLLRDWFPSVEHFSGQIVVDVEKLDQEVCSFMRKLALGEHSSITLQVVAPFADEYKKPTSLLPGSLKGIESADAYGPDDEDLADELQAILDAAVWGATADSGSTA
jgi:hypothetical protein